MKKIYGLLVLCAMVAISGCSTTIGNRNMSTSQSSVEAQMAQMTSKDQVRKKLGVPNLIFEKDGYEVYEYKQVRGSGRYHWMLPVVGWIMSWWQDEYAYTETNLFITFDGNDAVKDWQLIKTGGTTN